MSQGDINWELVNKSLEMVVARKHTRPEVGQEGNKISIFNSELEIRITELKNN